MNEADIIRGCLKNSIESQKALYEAYYRKMLSVCLRYSKNEAEAKQMLADGFLFIFSQLKFYKATEALGGWMKQRMIESAIIFLKKNRENMIVSTVHANNPKAQTKIVGDDFIDEEALPQIDKALLLRAIQGLAPAYRKVYNMSVIDSLTHAKIAELLDIAEETSVSTLSKAKFYLRKNIKQLIVLPDGN